MKNAMTLSHAKLLFEEKVMLTNLVEYGFSMQDILEGIKPIPEEGARFDIHFEGDLTGDKIKGKIRGVDYLKVRADRKFILNLQATIITDDGINIKVIETGTNLNGNLKLHMDFHTSNEKYSWLNTSTVVGIGSVDFNTGVVSVKGFSI